MERNILIRNISEDCHRLHWLQSGFSSLPRWKRVKADFFCKEKKSIVYMVQLKVATLSNKIAPPEGEKKWPRIFFFLYIEVRKQKSTAKSQQLSIPLNNFTVQIFPAHLVIVLVVCRSPISSFQNQYSQSWMWVITFIRTQDVQCRPPLLPLPLVLPPLLLPLNPDPADFSPNDWIPLLLSRRVSLSCHPHPLCMGWASCRE